MSIMRNSEEINLIREKIKGLMSKISKVADAVQDRKDFQNLRLSSKFFVLQANVKNFINSSNPDYLAGAVKFYMETGSSLEGEALFNSTIWNAEVDLDGKLVTLDILFMDLCDLYYSLKKELVVN